MPVTIKGIAKLHGLQHAEQQSIINYFYSYFSKGTITILSYAKATGTSAALAAGITGAALSVNYNGPGAQGKGGSELFAVPGPETGSGLSFSVAALLIGLFCIYRMKIAKKV